MNLRIAFFGISALALLVSCQSPVDDRAAGNANSSRAAATSLTATFSRVSSWPTGYTAKVVIKNSSGASSPDWTLTFALPAGTSVANGWNGAFSTTVSQVKVRALDYNRVLAAGATTELGFNANGTGDPTLLEVVGTVTTPTPTPTPTPSPTPTPTPGGWRLVWSDEFNGSGSVDPTKWTFDLGGGGFGNGELETYTNSAENVFQDGSGNLVLRAVSKNGSYSSGRIKTQGLKSFTYGKFEIRARLPFGQGIWPAFWMLGNNIGQVGWPNCGEIDVMENIGKTSEQIKIYGTLHGPGYSGGGGISTLYQGPRFADDFHTFTAEWEPGVVRFLCDGNLYRTLTNQDLAGRTWVFDHEFFLILNLAVGGGWPGNPDASTSFPQSFTIDYVRAWQR